MLQTTWCSELAENFTDFNSASMYSYNSCVCVHSYSMNNVFITSLHFAEIAVFEMKPALFATSPLECTTAVQDLQLAQAGTMALVTGESTDTLVSEYCIEWAALLVCIYSEMCPAGISIYPLPRAAWVSG